MSKLYSKSGTGFVNNVINSLPFEAHIKGYNFCGPGTKIRRRLSRGDKGINPLDEACKQHDIAYLKNENLQERHKADKILINTARKRFQSSDATFGEKLAALGVSTVMKAKVHLGAGCTSKRRKKMRKNKKKVGKCLTFREVVRRSQAAMKKDRSKDLNKNVKIALQAVRKIKRGKKLKVPRVIPLPKTGGFLPIIPAMAALSAIGALGGGAATIARAVNSAKMAREQLEESQKHNRAMEAIALGKNLKFKPYKNGLGLYFYKPPSKNYQ